MRKKPGYFILLTLFICIYCDETVSQIRDDKYSVAKDRKYLIYDVNRGEGFNLRRDVHMRIANTVRLLREAGENFVLVLPPWGGLYHWTRQETRVAWKTFFDLDSLNKFVPVVEFEQFVEEIPDKLIDNVVYLQHYAEGWGEKYELKYDKRECHDGHKYYKKDKSTESWKGWFFSFSGIKAKKFECISMQGDSGTLRNMILKNFSATSSIFIDRGETVLHEDYGGREYWRVRRSMRYAPNLIEEAAKFRKQYLNSIDKADKTELPSSWEDEIPIRKAIGGPYVCAHWRRRDFLRAHGRNLPSVEGTAKILNELAKKYDVKNVFLATDAEDVEFQQLQNLMEVNAMRYKNPSLSDGELAIIDQIICSRAKYFTGSYVSTFSYRIQEDREILGFKPETTFNRMCGDHEQECEQPAKWKIVY